MQVDEFGDMYAYISDAETFGKEFQSFLNAYKIKWSGIGAMKLAS